MVAYSFQKRFAGHIIAGLEPGPWLPGMKRHTLRMPRTGRNPHARPEQPVHLYTGLRSKQARLLGRAVCRLQMPVLLRLEQGALTLMRGVGPCPRSRLAHLAPVVQVLAEYREAVLFGESMDEFARTDGFANAAEMASFFEAPKDGIAHLPLVLIAWTPRDEA